MCFSLIVKSYFIYLILCEELFISSSSVRLFTLCSFDLVSCSITVCIRQQFVLFLLLFVFFGCLWKHNLVDKAEHTNTDESETGREEPGPVKSVLTCIGVIFICHRCLYGFLYIKRRLDTDTLWQIYVLEG